MSPISITPQPTGRHVALIKTFDRFPRPRPINGLFIAKDMTETAPNNSEDNRGSSSGAVRAAALR
jgi:hypothetical protein